MANILKHNVKLLKASFSKQEWASLKSNPKFKTRLKNAKDTFDDFENLVRLGNELVCDLEMEILKTKFQKASKPN